MVLARPRPGDHSDGNHKPKSQSGMSDVDWLIFFVLVSISMRMRETIGCWCPGAHLHSGKGFPHLGTSPSPVSVAIMFVLVMRFLKKYMFRAIRGIFALN